MKVAVAVMCFDRPDYLEQVLKSFENARGTKKLDWFFFQDGISSEVSGKRYTTQEKLDSVANLIENTKLPVKHFERLPYNIGPGQQRYRIYKILEDYDLMYIFDDDMVVGKDYFKLLYIMANQFPDHTGILYNNTRTKITKKNLKSLHRETIARLWGHYMWQSNWQKFHKDHKVYYEFIKQFDFHEIRKLTRSGELKRPPNIPSLSDDVVVNCLCRKYKIQKLVPKISRARYIGKRGIITYNTDRLWKKRGMSKQREKITFPEDEKLERFILK